MKTHRTQPGPWATAEANAEAELARRGIMRISEPGQLSRNAAMIDGRLTPWRATWQEVIADFRALYPSPETLTLK